MRVTNNGTIYDARPESIYSDISISADTLEEACAILESFESLSGYAFGLIPYTNMVVSKRSIVVVSNSIIVKIKLRKKTELELAQEEIAELRKALQKLLGGSNSNDGDNSNGTSSSLSQLLDKWRL